jgi:anti-anti-sigma factor
MAALPPGDRREVPDNLDTPGVRDACSRQPGTPTMRRLLGDLKGGSAAAMLTIPISMGFGMVALAPFGHDMAPVAALAGLHAALIGGIVALLLGARSTIIYAPRSIATFLISSLVIHSVLTTNIPGLQSATPATQLAVVFLLIFLAGMFQALFGVLRLGGLVRFLPAPVIAGFQNAAAILIVLAELDGMLGIGGEPSLTELLGRLGEAQPLTLLVGVVTCAAILRADRIVRGIPPIVFGLLVGIVLYYLLHALGLGDRMSPAIGPIEQVVPSPRYVETFLSLPLSSLLLPLLPTLLTGALSLAIVSSLDAMLCARLIETDAGRRIAHDRELVRVGAGNMVASCFGGIANSVNLVSSFANHRSGATTRWSLLVHTAMLSMALLVAPVLGMMPRIVISAMLVVVGFQLFNRWTWHLGRQVISGGQARVRNLQIDLAIILAVTATAVITNIVFAVLGGLMATVASFLLRISTSIVRSSYDAGDIRSLKTRDATREQLLTDHGDLIRVLELEGPLFFATAENLAARIEQVSPGSGHYLIIDMKRVTDVDSTGARVLLEALARMNAAGGHLVLSAVTERRAVAAALDDLHVLSTFTPSRLFPDVDHALEWAEDRVILAHQASSETSAELAPGTFDLLSGMTPEEAASIVGSLQRRVYARGDILFHEGDTSSELYVVARGSASARLRLSGAGRQARLSTFSAGTVFGEVALLDQDARSATVTADEELVCFVLTRASFEQLRRDHPEAAIRLLTNLGRELASHLRRSTRMIYRLTG